ncbi:MAG: ChbG/HpnK family deacetylase [Patescibacteria group bacterium]
MLNKDIRKKVIVTADDFGISEIANRKILELAESKKVDRVAIMASGILPQEDVNALLHSGVKLDIHLNMTEKFKGSRKLKEGIVKRSSLFLARYIGRQISASKVKKEWEEQIQKFKEIIGRYPDGLNSHQHIHYYPSYFKVAAELSEKYSIPFIRCGKKGFLGKINGVKQILAVLRRVDMRYLKKNRLQTSNYLVSLDWINNFGEFLNNLPDGTIEITFHPERREEYKIINNYF